MSFVSIVVRARLAGMSETLEEAAQDLYASRWQAFRYVTLPLILPGIIGGALLALTLSLDDVVITRVRRAATEIPIESSEMRVRLLVDGRSRPRQELDFEDLLRRTEESVPSARVVRHRRGGGGGGRRQEPAPGHAQRTRRPALLRHSGNALRPPGSMSATTGAAG